jgi:hypothetical protein
MLAPTLVLAGGILALGFFNSMIVTAVLQPVAVRFYNY